MTEEERIAQILAGMRNPYAAKPITMESQVQNELATLNPENMPPMTSYRQDVAGRAARSTAGQRSSLQQQMDYANMLRNTPAPQGKRVGPSQIYVENPWEGVSVGLQRALGGYQAGKLAKEAQKLDEVDSETLEAQGELSRLDKESDRTANQDFTAGESALDRSLKRELAMLKLAGDKSAAQAAARTAADKGESALRNEFSKLAHVKEFKTVDTAYQRVIESAKESVDGSGIRGAGDLALIFNYMKMLDPLSVVRESEFRTAAQAGAWLEKQSEDGVIVPRPIVLAIEKMVTGAGLTDSQRSDFVNRAGMLYEGASRSFSQTSQRYTDLATEYGYSPDRVVTVKPTDIGDDNRAWLETQKATGIVDVAGDAEPETEEAPEFVIPETKPPHMTEEAWKRLLELHEKRGR